MGATLGQSTDNDDVQIKGATDGTLIGNTTDRLKVTIPDTVTVQPLSDLGADISFGSITTVATTRVPVCRSTYTEQTANAQRSIVSSSANDTAAGTGARTVTLEYFTVTGTGPFTETITLNGTTPVNTVATDICYIEHLNVATVGSTGSNVGTISLKAATAGGGATIITITPTSNRMFCTHHYVSLGKTCYVSGIEVAHNGTAVGTGALYILTFKQLLVTGSVEQQVAEFIRLYGQSSTVSVPFVSRIPLTGFGRLRLLVTPETASSTTYYGSFTFSEY